MTALKPQDAAASSAPPADGTTPPAQLPPSPRARPTDDDIEAVILAATASRGSPTNPPRDTRTQLFVGNLPYRVRWQDLKDLFRKAGTVLRADVSLGPDNRSRGYGTVLLSTGEDAGRAIDMFNGYNWQTRVLEVRPDRLPPELDGLNGTTPPMSSGIQNPMMPYGSAMTPMQGSFPSEDPVNMLARPASSGLGKTLFVGNLPFHCQWQDLKDLFRQAGTILRADVAMGQDGRSRGFGMVSFATDQDADRAVKMFNGYEYNGRPLKVHYDKYAQSMSMPMSPMPSSPMLGYYAPSPMMHGMGLNGYPFEHFMPHGQPPSPFGPHPPPLSQHPSFHLAHHPSQLMKDGMGPLLDGTPLPSGSSSAHAAVTKSSASPNQHPMHPGNITLPPPPPPGSIMLPPTHTLSPYGFHPMGTPLGHPMSPLHHQVHMTPQGLPPMTPSMPRYGYIGHPSPSMGGPFHGPPVPLHVQALANAQHVAPGSKNSSPPSQATRDQSSTEAGITSTAPVAQMNGFVMMTPPTGPMSAVHNFGYAMGMLSPGLPFSPGVVMTPGAFWGSPNPYMNPAVGAPVHIAQSEQSSGGPQEEPGYFPPVDGGYFPPLAPQANASAQDSSGSSNGRSALGAGSQTGASSGVPSWTVEDASTTATSPQNDMSELIGRLSNMGVVADLAVSKAHTIVRPGLSRGDSDPTNGVSMPPAATIRHTSADALGMSANGQASTGVARTPPGALNLAALGLRLDQKRVF